MILSFDLETENHRHNKRLASPFDKRNYIAAIGWSVNGGKPQGKYYNKWHRDNVLPEIMDTMGEGDILNGFNIKFDLLWVWKEPRLQAALKRGMQIYCGQYAEYLLGGMQQEYQMVSMNEIAESYGGGAKIDAVKDMWEAGYLTSQVPEDLLMEYLLGNGKDIVGDIHNTWLILVGQINRMNKEHPKTFKQMFKHRMDGLLATTEMEYNGIFIDEPVAELERERLAAELEIAEAELVEFIPQLPPELIFNWGSATHKSALIFGGTVKYEKWLQHQDENGNLLYAKKDVSWPLFTYCGTQREIDPDDCKLAGSLYILEVPKEVFHAGSNKPVPGAFCHKDKWYIKQDTYVSGKLKGQPKFKKVKVSDLARPKGARKDHYFTFSGYTKPLPQWKLDSTDAYDKPLYSTGGDVIDKLADRNLPFTNALVKRTAMSKDLGTYYWTLDKSGERKGMLTLVEDGIIHHKLNHTSTVTTRLSSSDPNMQNIPRGNTSNVKKMMASRFGEDGLLAEIDYSQLEVVIQGVLTQDKQLCQDLRDRIDFHCKRLAVKINEPYEDVLRKCKVEELPDYVKMRTGAKEFSFQRAYGAGVEAVVESTGMSKQDVEALIAAEAKLYPGIAEFDKKLEQIIAMNRVPTSRKIFLEGVAFTQGQSHWDSPTGTRYTWREGITPGFMHERGKYTGFSPTERKNYPVQGFGGEVVQTQLGKVFRYFLQNDMFNGDVLLVNTVHDCVILDGKKGIIEKVTKEVQTILESIPEVFNKAFNLNIDVPFPCEAEVGSNLFTMHGLH